MTAEEFVQAFSAEIGIRPPTSDEVEALLDLASIAAHTSERIAAPLACWMAGVSGLPTPKLLAAAQRVAGEAT